MKLVSNGFQKVILAVFLPFFALVLLSGCKNPGETDFLWTNPTYDTAQVQIDGYYEQPVNPGETRSYSLLRSKPHQMNITYGVVYPVMMPNGQVMYQFAPTGQRENLGITWDDKRQDWMIRPSGRYESR